MPIITVSAYLIMRPATSSKKIILGYGKRFNTVSGEMDWNQYLRLLRMDGSMVVVGIPEKQVPIGASDLIQGRRSLAGSMVGGIAETQGMLDFCGKHDIVADIEVVPMQNVNQAFERMLKSDVRYRFVIDMASLKNG